MVCGTIGVLTHHVDPHNVDYQVSNIADFLQGERGEFVGVGKVGLDRWCHCKPKCPVSDECKENSLKS